MTDTIQDRLRAWNDGSIMAQAADEIDRLSQTVRTLQESLTERDKPCEWRQDQLTELQPWETSCGYAWCLDDGDPVLNRMNFCPSCGHPLKVVSDG